MANKATTNIPACFTLSLSHGVMCLADAIVVDISKVGLMVFG
jgi:hypothetical protein